MRLKKRLDQLLVERGLAPTRQKAHALIMAGSVLVDDAPAAKAGQPVPETAGIRLKAEPHPYVGRGGLKIEGAARAFGLDFADAVVIDIGASTGGFTHFALLSGARRVYAIDVDTSQLDWRLRNDSRVIPVEVNARFLGAEHVPEAADLIVVDVSFISVALIAPRIPPLLKSRGRCLILVKPQFEVGRSRVGKGGIVRDPEDWKAAVDRVQQACAAAGLEPVGVQESPILGREGNHEFLALFQKTS
ncbi:MAG TPA: TlyA family RNA methyltransferase [Terriglobia bacterium]|nr:TlyA family RNA methyltransferase [Terriglobia bacterium]